MPAISSTYPRSCLRGKGLHHRADVFRCITCIGFDRSDQKNHSSRTITVPPRGCRVKQTALCLFTMSKDPVVVTSQCLHNQTCSLFLRRIDRFGDHQGQPRRLGGARRDRTDDILLAKQALSQLSYGPTSFCKELVYRAGAARAAKAGGPG